jgi:hypothetical protein
MKKIISAVIIVGVMSQVANAMGPVGDRSHRHFYKDQEWIWQKLENKQEQPSDHGLTAKLNSIRIWSLPSPRYTPLAFTGPFRPPTQALAFTGPFRPPTQPLAFTGPFRPPGT